MLHHAKGHDHFCGEPRSNETHASTTDSDARLFKKAAGQATKLCQIGHALMENRNGLVVDTSLTKATGTAERKAAIGMIGNLPDNERITLGTDKGYNTQDFVADMRRLSVTPHAGRDEREHPANPVSAAMARLDSLPNTSATGTNRD